MAAHPCAASLVPDKAIYGQALTQSANCSIVQSIDEAFMKQPIHPTKESKIRWLKQNFHKRGLDFV